MEYRTNYANSLDEQELPPEPLWHTSDKNADKEGERCTVFWVNGNRYQGEWHGNLKHGKGTQYFKNGDKYEGNWVEDTRCGQGTYWKYESGKYRVQYNGEWKDNKKHGFGTYYDKKGDFYQGFWQENQRHGKGKQTYGGKPPDGFGGDVYEGEWCFNKRHGKGTLSLATGDVYQGEWADDLKHGPGTYFYETTQKRYDGVWKEGVPQCGSYTDITPGTKPPPPKLLVLELMDARSVERAAHEEAMRNL